MLRKLAWTMSWMSRWQEEHKQQQFWKQQATPRDSTDFIPTQTCLSAASNHKKSNKPKRSQTSLPSLRSSVWMSLTAECDALDAGTVCISGCACGCVCVCWCQCNHVTLSSANKETRDKQAALAKHWSDSVHNLVSRACNWRPCQ